MYLCDALAVYAGHGLPVRQVSAFWEPLCGVTWLHLYLSLWEKVPNMMVLNYLDFEYSEDAHGVGTFDAVASIRAALVDAVHAEIVQVLDWAYATFANGYGALDNGGEWDYDLQAAQEFWVQDTVCYDKDVGVLTVQPGVLNVPRYTLSLSLSGTPGFCAALRQQFDLD